VETQVYNYRIVAGKYKLTNPSSLVLLAMCEKMMSTEDESELRSIHGYLAARLLLLNSIKVKFTIGRSFISNELTIAA
jgi:hypothetical protein